MVIIEYLITMHLEYSVLLNKEKAGHVNPLIQTR